jgi:ribosomal protein S18 acetylase RimI-like enzyme
MRFQDFNMTLQFSMEPDANDEDKAYIEQSLYTFNAKMVPDASYHPINIFLRDDAKQIHGGLIGGCWGGWFHISIVWIAESSRGQGYGTQLMTMAENQAIEHGCHSAFLETHSFQAPELYRRLGYTTVGELPDYPPGYTFYIMQKRLSGKENPDVRG